MTIYPTVFTDGGREVEGAYEYCPAMVEMYRERVEARLAETGGMSPVAISGDAWFDQDSVAISATFRLVDPIHLENLRATLLIYENGVHGPPDPIGRTTYNGVTRKIYDEPIPLTNPNDQVTVKMTVPIGAGWMADSLRFVAYLQQAVTREMIQAANLPSPAICAMHFDHRRRSVPNANGVAVFQGTVTNLTDQEQNVTIEPGIPFGDWALDYLLRDDPNPHSGATEITLEPNEVCDLALRVTTDAAREARTGSLEVITQINHVEARLRVYNGSPSVLVVDNDGSGSDEVPIVNALGAGGYLYDEYSVVDHQASPDLYYLDGYDVVVWETGVRTTGALDDAAVQTLMGYLDQGGSLFLTSPYFLNTVPAEGTPFSRDYLGVDSFVLDKGYHNLIGFAGDPIGSGLVLPLHFPYPSWYRGDDAVPTSGARTVLVANDGSHSMLRNVTPSGAKVVFFAEAFEGISETDPDPNNTRVVLSRIITWLEPDQTVDAGRTNVEAPSSAITGTRPNPFNPVTEIAFALSQRAAAAPIRLEVFDPTGRRIAALLNGRLTAGAHSITWDGGAGGGGAIQSGIYLARLTTLDGASTWKLVLLR